jgi:hypothetical protein
LRAARERKLLASVDAARRVLATIRQPAVSKDEPTDADARMRVAKHGDDGASHALTYYATVDQAAQKLAWLSLKPVTGRTHQLRAHAGRLVLDEVGRDPALAGAGHAGHQRPVDLARGAGAEALGQRRRGQTRLGA